MSFRVQYGNERYVVCDDEAQRSTDVSGAPSRVQMSGTCQECKQMRSICEKNPKVVGDASLCSLFRRCAPYKSRLRNQHCEPI